MTKFGVRASSRFVSLVVMAAALLLMTGTPQAVAAIADSAATPSALLKSLPNESAVAGAVGARVLPQLTVARLANAPRGLLERQQVVAQLGHNGIFKGAFNKDQGGGGASIAFQVKYSGSPLDDYTFLAIKFPNESAGRAFAASYLAALVSAGAKQWEGNTTARLGFGALPVNERVIYYLVPPSSFGSTLGTTSIEQSLYANGAYFLITGVAIGRPTLYGDNDVNGLAQIVDANYRYCLRYANFC